MFAVKNPGLKKGDWIEIFGLTSEPDTISVVQITDIQANDIKIELETDDKKKKDVHTIPIDSVDIHPLGWSLSTNYNVIAPKGHSIYLQYRSFAVFQLDI